MFTEAKHKSTQALQHCIPVTYSKPAACVKHAQYHRLWSARVEMCDLVTECLMVVHAL